MKEQLQLLRDENLILQQRLVDLQKRYDTLQAENHLQNGNEFGDSFAEKLINLVHDLCGKDLYRFFNFIMMHNVNFSDLDILTDGKLIRAHRLVIAARTNYFGDLSDKTDIDFQTTNDIASTILKWIYSDKLDEKWGVLFLLEVLKVAHRFELYELTKRFTFIQTWDKLLFRCEASIITQLEVNNCIKIYQEAEQLKLKRLSTACTQFIAASWDLFEPEHFADLNGEFLFDLLKSHCKHFLHSTIRLKRPDVMKLFLNENPTSSSVNEMDELENLPLDLALNERLFETAKILCEHGADVNKVDAKGKTFIAKAIETNNVQSCEFLVDNGAKINYVNETTGETLIHTLASSSAVQSEIEEWSKRNIHLFDLNARDKNGRTALLLAIVHRNKAIFDLLLEQEQIDVNIVDNEKKSALEVALFDAKDMDMASALVNNHGDINSTNANGDNMLHVAIARSDFAAIQFLAKQQINVNAKNKKVDIANFNRLSFLGHNLSAHIFVWSSIAWPY